MKMLKPSILFLILSLAFPYGADSATAAVDQPHWSLEFKGGLFYPDIDNWQTAYDDRKTSHFAGTLAYKVLRQIEIGLEGGYISDTGRGFAPLHGSFAGTVKYELFPVGAFLLVRAVFSEDQWLVPYVGGGWTRMYYREKIESQAIVKGSADGYYGKAGLQMLLDPLDQEAANAFSRDYGIDHTYFFLEVQRSRVMIDTVDTTPVRINLGGTSFLAGLLFEF